MPTTATMSRRLDTLAIAADADGGDVTVGRTPGGELQVDGGATRIKGGKATVGHTERVLVLGSAADDRVTVDTANGTLPPIVVAGGAGQDTLAVAGSASSDSVEIDGADAFAHIVGQSSAGGLLSVGMAGVETVVFRPGAGGDEVVVGQLAGSGVARVEVQFGSDGAADILAVHVADGGASLTLAVADGAASVSGASVAVAATGIEAGDRFLLVGGAGAEQLDARGVVQRVDMLGFGGGDTLLGGAGNDALQAMDGDDDVTGGAGDDLVTLADGDDVARWSVGDGSDTVSGGAGSDRLAIAGTAGADLFGIAALGAGVAVSHGGLATVLSVDGVETLHIVAGAGADAIDIGALAGTGVQRVEIDLGADGAPDRVQVAGLAGLPTALSGGLLYTTTAGLQIFVTGLDAGTDAVVALG